MSQKPLIKSPAETVRFDVDCTRRLDTADSIASVDSVIVSPTTSPALTAAASVNTADKDVTHPITGLSYTVTTGKLISLTVAGGHAYSSRAGRRHTVTLGVTTMAGYHLEFIVPIEVAEHPEGGGVY